MRPSIHRRAVLKAMGLSLPALGLMAFVQQDTPDPAAPVHIENNDPGWSILNGATVETDSKRGILTAKFTDAILSMDKTKVKIGGFMLPLDASQSFNHFVLTRRNSSCPFCPPNAPTEAIEVFANDSFSFSMDEYEVTGDFETIAEATDGLFYRMRNVTVSKLA